jgi:hypothetical protein
MRVTLGIKSASPHPQNSTVTADQLNTKAVSGRTAERSKIFLIANSQWTLDYTH